MAIATNSSNAANAASQCLRFTLRALAGVAFNGVRPERLEDRLFLHQPPGVLRQQDQQIEDLRLQLHHRLAPHQQPFAHVQLKLAEFIPPFRVLARAQIAPQLAEVRIAATPVFFQHPPHDAFQVRCDLGIERIERGRFGVQQAVDHRDLGLAGEWQPASEQFVEHHAEREDVAAAIYLFAHRLFGRHIGQRPHHQTGRGMQATRVKPLQCVVVGVFSDKLRQAEIEHLDPPV
jgi:hypothetical protein